MKISNKSLLLASILSVLIDNSTAALAGGYDSTTDVNNFMANGTPVMTLTGSTKNAHFVGSVSVDGSVTSAGILSAPAGINVNNNSFLYSNGAATFAGSVGVGTASPIAALDVRGAVRAARGAPSSSDISTNGYAFGADGDTGLFSPLRTDGPANNGNNNGELGLFVNNYEALHIKYTGKVGIGTENPQATLDVNGEVKIGDTGVSCSSTNEGALQYDNGNHVMDYCNRNAWTPLGSNVSRTVTAQLTGWRWPAPTALCSDKEIVVGGGGTCTSPDGWNFIYGSHPDGNGWTVQCDTPIGHNTLATAYAICLDKNGATTTTNTPTTTATTTATTAANIATNVSCPAGKVLAGISDGQPVCTTSTTASIGLNETIAISAQSTRGNNYYQSNTAWTARTHDFCVISASQHDGRDSNCEMGGSVGGLWWVKADSGIADYEQDGTTNCQMTCYNFQ